MSARTTGRPLRAGVVGLGWAGQQHMAAYAQLPGVELVALAGQEPEQLATLAQTYGVADTFADAEAMLATAELDVVSLATPTALHAPMSIKALDAGVHVLCEKPMAENAARAREMVAAATANDRVLDVTFNKRRGREVTALHQLATDGLLGRIYYVKCGWLRRTGIPGLGSWFTQQAMAGGGPMMDIGVHVLDMALHVMGEPEVHAVTGATYAEFGPRGLGGSPGTAGNKWVPEGGGSTKFEVEDLGTAFVRMTDGATLLVEASWAQYVPRDLMYLTVYGTKGGANLELPTGPGSTPHLSVVTDVDGIPAELSPILGPEGGHADCVATFVDTVGSGNWDAHRGRVGLKRTAIIDACYASAASRSEVVLD
ncbi:Gfo/Idh/MocA family protein [Propionibacteriaceae bacterium Y2011]